VAASEDEGHPDDGGARAGVEHGLFPEQLRPAVDADRPRRVGLPEEGPVAPEHEVGGEGDEARPAAGALAGEGAGQLDVDALGLPGPRLAQVGPAEDGRVDDGVGALLPEDRGEGALVQEVGGAGAGARGRRPAAVEGEDVEAAGVEEGGEPPPEEPAGAGDEDPQGRQPAMTAPPFTERTSPCM
jgi:hypothetical protein